MIRQMLLDACSPDWGFIERLCEDIQSKLDEGSLGIVEHTHLSERLVALRAYEEWFCRARLVLITL